MMFQLGSPSGWLAMTAAWLIAWAACVGAAAAGACSYGAPVPGHFLSGWLIQ